MKRLKVFWNKLNYPKEILDNLLLEETEDNAADLDNPEEIAESFLQTQRKLILDNSGLFSKEHMDAEFIKHRKKLASDINKALNVGFTRSQLDELEWNDFMNKVKEFHETSVTSASKLTDNETQDLIHKLKSEKATLLEQVRALEDSVEDKVKQRTEELEREIATETVERLFNDTFNDQEFSWNDRTKKRDQFYIKQQILDNYEVHKDGRLTQNGGKDAVNFAGNGHYKNLKEAVKYLFETEGMSPQHKGGTGAGGSEPVVVSKVKIEGDKIGDNAQSMMERAIKQRKEIGLDI